MVDAPWVPWVTAPEPPGRQESALENPVPLDRCQRILRTGGIKTACGYPERRDGKLIKPDGSYQNFPRNPPRSTPSRGRSIIPRLGGGFHAHVTGSLTVIFAVYLARPDWISRFNAAKSDRPAAGNALTTMSVPRGRSGNSCAIMARSRRFTRLRVTAGPTALDTTKPTREQPSCCSLRRCKTKFLRPIRAPPRTTRSKSAEQRMRCAAGSTTRLRQKARDVPYDGVQTKSHVRRGYAYATGSHGPWPGGGYSAEKSAYSRQISKLLRGSCSKLDHFEQKTKCSS